MTRTMDAFFTGDDFDLGVAEAGEGNLLIQTVTECRWAHAEMTKQANIILREFFETALEVYGRVEPGKMPATAPATATAETFFFNFPSSGGKCG